MKNLYFIKNYLYILILSYITILFSKFIFYFYLIEYFNDLSIQTALYSILWGYKFDFAIAAIISLLLTFFDFNKKALCFITALFISSVFLAQISDIMYFYESNRHMGYEISDALTDSFGLIMTAISQHTILFISSLVLTIVIFLLSNKILTNYVKKVEINKAYIFKKLILIIISVFFIRGMIQGIPLNPWQSNQIGDAKQAVLALTGSYNAVYSLINKGKKLKAFKLPNIKKEIVESSIKTIYSSDYIKYKTNLQKPNVIFFFLESWSAVNMQSYGNEVQTTPFYDEILEKSIRPKAMMAGGHRTTEGMFASLSSYQNPLGKTIAKTQLQDYKYTSLINILNGNNYSSAFFQGSSKETSGTGSLAQNLGFKESYGKRDIIKRIYEENYWGVHDPDLYNFSLLKLKNMKKPFVLGINGATTHDDKIPSAIKEKFFIKDKKLNKQFNALNFSDAALKQYVKKVQELYPNTIFIFLADHCGGVRGSAFENYLIPFAIYHKDLKPKYYDFYISQRDIAPSIIDLVFGNYKNISNNFSGKSLLSDKTFYADYFHNGILGWIEGTKGVEINLSNHKYKCFEASTFKDVSIKCTDDIINVKNRALSFTKVSQELLFEGKTNKFKEYK